MTRILAALAFLLLVQPAFAVNPDEMLADPVLEARARDISEGLRCLVCQNQSLADSNAELAGDLRKQVREQVAAGRSDEQIIEYLVQRYGDFVLYEPPFKATTALLWIGPFVLLLGAGAVLVVVLRRRRDAPEELALGPDDRRVVDRVLGPQDKA